MVANAAEQRDVRALLEQQQAELHRLEHAAGRAEALQEQEAGLRARMATLRLEYEDLASLRQVARELDGLALRREAAATRLQYRLPPGSVTLEEEALSGEGERFVTARTEIRLQDGGWLAITPGGSDLAALSAQEADVRERFRRALASVGTDSLEQAEAQWLALESIRHEADVLRRELAIHAPEGIPEIRRRMDEVRRLLQKLSARLEEPAKVCSEEPAPEASMLHSDLAAAEAAQEAADAHLANCRERLHNAVARVQELTSRASLLEARLTDAAAVARREALDRRLAETRSLRDDLGRRMAAIEARIAEHRPDLVEQDIQRLERSASIAREAYQARQREILLLQGRLDEAGEQGIGERLTECEAQLTRLTNRHDALQRRARALDLLHELLETQRREATDRLQAPLVQRLNHYLGLLFPGASLQLDDTFLPRDFVRGTHCDEMGGLSFGTQEQLGILARFAYADLLKQAGRPTLLILDDALVHTDEHRRELMKRALFDAASRHQILMFTCHGSAWKDLGVTQRSIQALQTSLSVA